MVNALEKIADRAQAALDDGATDAARTIASGAASRAAAIGGATALVAGAIRSSGPDVSIAGGGRASRYATVGDLMFAAEYGARTPQTRKRWPGHPWRGSGDGAGYFLWPTVAKSDDRIMDDWTAEFDQLIRQVW